VEVYQKLVA